MIDWEYADLFYGSHDKQWWFVDVTHDSGSLDSLTFSNNSIVSENITLERSMCESDFFQYGTYSSSCIKVQVLDTEHRYVGVRFLVMLLIDGHDLDVGYFTCYSDRLSSDRKSRELVMYDDLYRLNEIDVAHWYNHYWDNSDTVLFAQFRLDFFYNCLHIDAELTDTQGSMLSNDNLYIKKAADYRTLSASAVLKSILLINCVNGSMSNSRTAYGTNTFKWVRIKNYDMHMAPPNPHWDIVPDVVLDTSKFYNCNYEEYEVLYADGIRIVIDPDNVIVPVYPSHDLPTVDNTLSISYDTMLLRNMEQNELVDILGNNYDNVHHRISFTPAEIQMRGNLCYEPGDVVEVDIDGKTIYTVIIKQTITGVQGLTMTLSCKGDEYFSNPLSVESDSYDDYSGSDPSVGGASVIANPDEDATAELTKVKINNVVYDIAGGGASTAYITQNVVSREIQQSEVTVVQTSFNTNKGTSAIFNGQALITSSADSVVTVKYYLNNELEDYIGEQTLVASGTTMLPLYKNFPALDPDTSYALKVTMTSSAGTITLNALNLHGSIICYNLSEMQGVVTASDVAVAHTSYEGTDDVIWVAYIENGLLKVKLAMDSDPIVWANYDIPRITGARTISMAFNSVLTGGDSDYYEFITEPKPYIAYVKGRQLHCLNLNTNEDTLLVSGNVDDASLVRSPIMPNGTDYGFTAFFLMENILYYRQYINGVWYDAEAVGLQIPDVTYKSIEAFVTWDYRTGILVTDSDDNLYQIISYPEGMFNQEHHIELCNIRADTLLLPIIYHDAQLQSEHIDLTVTSNALLLYAFSSIPIATENISSSEVLVTFDYPVTIGTATVSMFSLTDSNNINYVCVGASNTASGELLLTFAAFDLAAYSTGLTLTYTKPSSGGVMSPAVPADSFVETFVPTNLNPPQINPPAFASASNSSDGMTIDVTFDEVITNSDTSELSSAFSVITNEYEYVPNGRLQPVAHSVRSVEKLSDTALRLLLSTPSISSAIGDVSIVYDGLGGLRGYGGPVSSFTAAFTPSGLTWSGHQNDAEHIKITALTPSVILHPISYISAKAQDEHIDILQIITTVTLTDIHNL